MSVDGEDGFYRALRWKGQSDRAATLVLFFPSTHFWSDLTARCKPVACGSRVVKCAPVGETHDGTAEMFILMRGWVVE